jgi:2-oxoglutarate ferredoxin oxidoreductase subunit beta
MPEELYELESEIPTNTVEDLLRMDRMPHIWCPGCGIGTTMNCFAHALETSGLDLTRVSVVSGIGCTGRVAGYLNLDSFHTTHGRAIPFATGLKLANPSLKVVVYSGDGDLSAIGGNHFIHAARRNVDITVILINNSTYGMTGGQVAPTTPMTAVASTAPYGNFESAFNLPALADSCGAVYVARWTAFHVRHTTKAIKEALAKRGFSFIEILAPCPTLYSRRNKLGDGRAQMLYYQQQSEVRNGADTKDVALGFQGKIIVGKFVDRERQTFDDAMAEYYTRRLGDRYVAPTLTGA